MRFRAMLALMAVVVGAFTFAPAAMAQCYPGSKGVSIAVSTTRPLPGEQITVSGKNFAENSTVRLELDSKAYHLATVTADANGSFTTTVTLPNGVFGTHRIVGVGTAMNPDCPGTPVAVIHIQQHGAEGSSAGPGHHGTAFTGVDVLLIVVVAVALIGAGVALTRGGRRKQSSGHPLID